MRRRVVVTGVGALTALGEDVAAFAAALRAGRSGVRSVVDGVPGARLAWPSLTDRLRSYDLPPAAAARARTCAERAPRAVQAAVASALQAWAQAGLFARPPEPAEVSLVVAGQNIQPGYAWEVGQKFQRAPAHTPPRYALHFMDTDHVGVVSEVLGVRGEGLTVGGASASGNVGVLHGLRLVREGAAEVCVVVGAMADLSPVELQALRAIGALANPAPGVAPETVCRPFDADHAGFVPGEGTACLVLEGEDAARARGATALAEVAGGAVRLDASRLSDPMPAGEARAMRAALRDAGLAPGDVDYVNAHATSTPAGDEAEVAALREVFGDDAARVWVNATKGLTGHCLWSAGVVEAVATVVQMREGFVHPNANLARPIDPALRFAGAASAPAAIRVALSNGFGFGGINSAIVLRAPHEGER